MTTPSLYDRLGGRAAVNAAVEDFYRRVLADERVSPFFSDVDMPGQIAKQRAFLIMAFGGPAKYTGRMMADAHRPLLARGLNDSHVDVIKEHLGNTLLDLGVESSMVDEVLAIAESTREAVLCREESAEES